MQICVETTAGKVRGWTDGSVASFLGIPYGEAPTGVRRFQPAAATAPWVGVRDATRFGPVCPQTLLTFDYAWCGFVGVGAEVRNEDCLTLNVWTAAPDRGSSLPVLFWIHGGGFGSGGPAFLNTDGMALARRADVVIVSVTHRLNVFGHLFLGGIAGEPYRDSANVGHIDIVRALEWVRDNIAQFGGDPGNVTLFGQSGGAAKIGCLMAMPAARGLFHGAVMQSGVRTVGPTLEQADDYARRLLDHLDVSPDQWQRLLELRDERLLQAATDLDVVRKRDFIEPGPVPDGHALPQPVIDSVRAGSASGVRLIIGTCLDELQLSWKPITERPPLEEMRDRLGEYGDQVVDGYLAGASDASQDELAKLLTSDWKFRVPSIRFAEAQLAGGARDVYMYVFGWSSSVMPEARAAHSMDIPFWFGNTSKMPVTASDPSSGGLELQMMDALVAFARTGDPNHARLPVWPRYDPALRATMIFDHPSHSEDDPKGQNRRAWQDVPVSKLGV
jgi:para-nitrobenzyl esterase